MPFPRRRQPACRLLIISQLTARHRRGQAASAGPSLAIWSARQTPGHPERNFHSAGKQRDTQEIKGSIKRSSHWGGRGRDDSSPPCKMEKGGAGEKEGKANPPLPRILRPRAQQDYNKAILVTMKSKPYSPSQALPLCKMGH